MFFHSTRGIDKNKTFEEVLIQGLADDGGLFMPDHWPELDLNHISKQESFVDVAKYIIPFFTKSSFTEKEVEEILNNTWHDFSQKDLELKYTALIRASTIKKSKYDLIADYKKVISKKRKDEVIRKLEELSESKYKIGDFKGSIKAIRRAEKYY